MTYAEKLAVLEEWWVLHNDLGPPKPVQDENGNVAVLPPPIWVSPIVLLDPAEYLQITQESATKATGFLIWIAGWISPLQPPPQAP